jgi:vitamin B12 transporter
MISPLLAASAASLVAPDTMTVTATRFAIPYAETGQSLTVLDAARLETLQLPLLSDILALTPSVSVSRNGGAGGFTAVRIRGAEGEQTVVVVDGVRLADVASPGGGYDFAGLLNLNLQSVEVLRGPQSLAWGSQAIGGVVAVTTALPTRDLELAGRAEGGARGEALVAARASGTNGRLAWSFGGNFARTDGISAAAESRGASERDDWASWGLSGRAVLTLGVGFSLDFRGRTQQSDFGIDGFPPPSFALADTDERSDSGEVSGAAILRWQSADGRLDQRLIYDAAQVRRRTYLPGATPEDSFRSSGTVQRLSWLGRFGLSDALALDAGAEQQWFSLSVSYPSGLDPDPEPARDSTSITSLFAALQATPMAGLAFGGGVRLDHQDPWGNVVTGSANVSFAPNDGPVRLKASFGQGFKAPTLFQLGSDFGNPDLAPERATGYDAGVEARLLEGRLVAGATWFQRWTKDQIDFVSCFANPLPACANRPFGTYDNIRRAQAEGVELELSLTPIDSLNMGFQYSWLSAENRSEGTAAFGNALPRRPGDDLAMTIDWVAPAGFSLGATVQVVGNSFDDALNLRRIPGYATLDLRGAVPIAKRFEAYWRVTNVTNAIYETASFYGQPGRGFAVGIRAAY